MIREVFHIGSLSISPFGLMLSVAFIASYFQLRWGLKSLGAGDEEDASALLVAAGLGGVVGAKVYFAVLSGDWRVLFARWGLVWYGGFLLGIVAVLLVIRWRRLPGWAVADATAPTLALGYAIGRVGCFLVGDDYGRPTERAWGVAFPHGLPESTAGNLRDEFGVEVPAEIPDSQLLSVHPTQLYETALALGIWAVGLALLRRRARPGTVALVVIGLMAVERFAIEFLRAKDDRYLGEFTVAQLISVLVLIAVAGLWLARRDRASMAVQRQAPRPGDA